MPTASRLALRAACSLSILVGALGLCAAAASADPALLYLREDAAVAIDHGLGGGTFRQAPASMHPRWSPQRTVGKVSGRELAALGAPGIAGTLRRHWRQDGAAGLVSVDEITPRQWTPASASALATALDMLGADASRVIFYAAPSFVGQVGRADPRRGLSPVLGGLVDAVSRGRATYLVAYTGSLAALEPREMATYPTRWLARWPAGRGELRLMLGPDGGAGQAELWSRVRATPAGRELLARGPAAYGLADGAAARSWLDQYRAFRASPAAAVTGSDFPVPLPGGLTLTAEGPRRVRVTLGRAGNAVITMTPVRGGKVRAIRKLVGPASGVAVSLPSDSRPGLYRIQAILIGDGLRDRTSITVRVRR